MKTRFLKAFAAVMMLFSFAGFVRAEGELVITAAIANAGENVVLSEITSNACSANDVVLSADTKLTLTCEGADIYYTTDGTEPSKPEATEPAAKEGESTSTLYADPFVLTNTMVADGKIVVKAIAYKQASTPDAGAKATAEQSDVLTITLTLKVEAPEPVDPVAVPTFVKKEGTEADTIIVLKGAENDSLFVATGNDSTSAVAAGFAKFVANDTIAVSEDLVIVAYTKKGESVSDTVKYIYTKAVTPAPSVKMYFIPSTQYEFELVENQTTLTTGYGLPAMIGLKVTGTEDEYLPAEIYYTLDGTTEPDKDAYTEEGVIKKLDAPESQASIYFDDNVAAAKFKAYVENGDDIIESEIHTIAVTVVKAPVPTFNPASGAKVEGGSTIEIEAEEGALPYYTLDGTEPDIYSDNEVNEYEEAIVVPEDSTSMTIKARVYMMNEDDGLMYASEVVTATYTIGAASEAEEVDDLAALNALYNDFDKDQVYTVKGEVTIAGIIVSGTRTNALVQDKGCENTKGHSMLLYGVTLPENAKVGDVLKDLSGKLTTYSGLLEMTGVTVAAAGTTAAVTIDTVTIAELKADETMAYQSALVCVEEVAFDCDTTFASGKNYNLIQGADTLAFRANGGADYIGMDIPAEKITLIGYMGYFNAYQISPRSKADIIDGSVVAEVAAPTFDPEAGAVDKDTKVTVSSTTEGAEIWIAVGEGEFEKKNEVTISEAVTLRAFAEKDGVCSDTVEAAYTIKTVANKDFQTADVKVYPNPNNGMFFVELSEASLVEVFSANGMLCLRQQLPAGTSTLNVANSGFYFVRINNNIVKRIVVR